MYRPPVRLSSPSIRYVAMTLDVLIIWGCALVAFFWYGGTAEEGRVPPRYELIVLAASLLLLAFSSSIYRSWRVNDLWLMLRSVMVGWLAVAGALLLWLFATKTSSDYSRVWFTGWVGGTLVALCLQRLLVYAGLRWLRRQGYNYKTVVLVGVGPTSERVQQALAESAWSGLRLLTKLPADELAAFMDLQQQNKNQVDEVWLCLPFGDKAGILTALEALHYSTANIRLVRDMFALKLINYGVSEVVGIPMLDLSASPITGGTRLLKAAQDYLLALVILLLISPLLLGIALAVKLTSRGPVLYRQRRHGWNGEEIRVYKFRSMVVHQEKDFQVTQARRNDARITPLGAFLRRTSLDELPQFFNVLQGRMSIVGPRPHAMVHNEYYKQLVPGYMLRHKVKPGITGWAQINGFRGETDTLDKMQKRVEYDLHYIENLSLALDLKIIVLTVFRGFVNRNAY